MKFRYYQGVRYVAPHKPAPATFTRCGSCGRAWDDDKPTGLTPAPSGRCPFEYMHKAPKSKPARRAAPAPDMLAAMELALSALRCEDEFEYLSRRSSGEQIDAAHDILQEAISKAKGAL